MTAACPHCGGPLALVSATSPAGPDLAPADPHPGDPPWLRVALGELGQREVVGSAHNPRIVEYHSATSLRATDDETPWCASFVSWCLEQAGIPSTRSARALSYAKWGQACVPWRRGAVVVFDHGGGKGHVGFFLDESPSSGMVVLGGNQGDSVKVSAFGGDKLIVVRWPEDSTR